MVVLVWLFLCYHVVACWETTFQGRHLSGASSDLDEPTFYGGKCSLGSKSLSYSKMCHGQMLSLERVNIGSFVIENYGFWDFWRLDLGIYRISIWQPPAAPSTPATECEQNFNSKFRVHSELDYRKRGERQYCQIQSKYFPYFKYIKKYNTRIGCINLLTFFLEYNSSTLCNKSGLL